MREYNGGSIGQALVLFAAGAAIGGLLVALNTPKSGPELREDIKGLARRARKKAGDLAEDAEGAWDRMRGKTQEAGEAVKQEVGELARH
jgi:gas vesicle protein